MQLERLDDAAQAILQAAQEIMHEQRHPQLDVEHLGLALLRQPEGQIARALERLGVDAAAVARQLEQELMKAPKVYGQHRSDQHIYITPRTQRLLKRAEAEAARGGDRSIGVEHLLLALSLEHEEASARVLGSFGIDQERVRTVLLELRGTPDQTDHLPPAVADPHARRGQSLEARIAALEEALIRLQHAHQAEQPEAAQLRAALQQAQQQIAALELQNQHLRELLRITQEHLASTRELLAKELGWHHRPRKRRAPQTTGDDEQETA
jgi:regulator of replication initiation timing